MVPENTSNGIKKFLNTKGFHQKNVLTYYQTRMFDLIGKICTIRFRTSTQATELSL